MFEIPMKKMFYALKRKFTRCDKDLLRLRATPFFKGFLFMSKIVNKEVRY